MEARLSLPTGLWGAVLPIDETLLSREFQLSMFLAS